MPLKTEEGQTGWGEYRELVLSNLEEIKKSAQETEVRLRGIELEIALLKLKSSLWGGLAGLGAFTATWLIQFLSRR